MRMAKCLKLRLLLKIAKCWSVDEAAWVLDAFWGEKLDDTFYWNSFITDVETLRAANHGLACSVLLVFNGGPFGDKGYRGSFAMFVVDRVLFSGKDWDWLLHFNRDTTTHIADQELMPDKLGRQVSQTCPGPEEKDDGIVRRWTSSGLVVRGGEK